MFAILATPESASQGAISLDKDKVREVGVIVTPEPNLKR